MRQARLVPSILLTLFAFTGGLGFAEETPKIAGEEVPAPKRTKTVLPEYPAEAQAKGIYGIVIVELVIDVQGHVASARIVRTVPGLDEAALAAVKKWEYEITRVSGKPVSVRLTYPIAFTMKMPQVTRQEGIPELRRGASPEFPTGGPTKGGAVTAEVTLAADGKVSEIQVKSGEEAFAQALVKALKTWAFAPAEENVVVSFRVEATFDPGGHGQKPSVPIHLSGLHKSESVAAASVAPSPTPSAPSQPVVASQEAIPASPGPAPLPTPVGSPSPAVATPPNESLAVPTPPPLPPESGASAIRDVTLQPGVPELVKGRRPVVPPSARFSRTAGSVEVRFRVDAGGGTLVTEVAGPDILKAEAEQAVASWNFRRTRADRLALVAVFTYKGDGASAVVRPAE